MLDEIYQYADSLYVMECMTNSKTKVKRIVKNKDSIQFLYSFNQLTRDHVNKITVEKTIQKALFTLERELDFSVSFKGEFSKWHPMTEILKNYFPNHNGYKQTIKCRSSSDSQWYFNFKDIDSIKEFITSYVWRVWIGR